MSSPPKPATQPQQVFLGWKQPTLHAARDFLKKRYLKGRQWDMDRVLLVLPSSFAGRRLGELLAEAAELHGWLLRPPEIVTVGALPEKLYQAQFPYANDLVQVLCWAKVLRESSVERLKPLLVDVPSSDATKTWIDLARLLSNLHRELATDLLLFHDVADRLNGTPEEERWRVLAYVQREYLNQLHKYQLWDVQTARRVAIDRDEPKTDRDIVVLGAVDMNRAQRRFLDAVAKQVTVLIGAPEAWSAGFDQHGALIPEFWQNLEVAIDDASLHICNSIDEAADEVARQLANLPAGLSTQQITIGVPDAEVIPGICERLSRANVSARYGPGTPVNQSSPMRLLEALSHYLEKGDYPSFASLIRHPMISAMLRSEGKLPEAYLPRVDDYYNETLIRSMNSPQWPEGRHRETVENLVNEIDAWLKPIRVLPQSLSAWSPPLLQVIQRLFANTTVQLDLPEHARLWEACTKIRDAMTLLDDIPADLQVDVSVTEAIGWVKSLLEKERIPPQINPAAIEMLGWLELALDDTEALMLTGLHDGAVPESVNADAFLPNELRRSLGLMDNSRRYARDCYVLQTILQTRRHVSIVAHQLDQKGDPLTPSRLLLAVQANDLAPRVKRLLHPEDKGTLRPLQGRWLPVEGKTRIPIPQPKFEDLPTSIPVTDFKYYAECPYRYYLGRIEKLKSVHDDIEELQANAFGDLLHNCLQGLKQSPVEASQDATAIADWLCWRLDQQVEKAYGKFPSSTVAIQIEQAKQRLAAFAVLQAERVKEGWEIYATEMEFKPHQSYVVEFEGGAMSVHGRIDRIDLHPVSRTWAIWDYKSGDGGDLPKAAHYSAKTGWKDFQLPLYRHLIRYIPDFRPSDQVIVGYILLPKSTAKCAFADADFDEASLAQADEAIASIASKIRRGVFWPPVFEGIPMWDPYASICQTNLARPWRPEDAMRTAITERPVPSLDNQVPRDGTKSLPDSQGLESPPQKISGQSQTLSSVPVIASQGNQLNLIQKEIPGWTAGRIAYRMPPTPLIQPTARGSSEFPPEWFDPLVIQASAGTGKTYRLSVRMMQLLFTEQPLDHVLATTFTRKAAGEILHRVLGRLADAILSPSKLAELRGNLAPLDIQVEHCQYQLARLCSQLHRFRISTLDAFYAQLAKSFSLELQLPPGWKLADNFEERRLRNLAITRMLESHDRAKLRTIIGLLFKGDSQRSIQSQVGQVIEAGYRLYRETSPDAWDTLPEVTLASDSQLLDLSERLRKFEFPQASLVKANQKLQEFLLSQQWKEVVSSTLVKSPNLDPPTYSRIRLNPDFVALLIDVGDAAARFLLSQLRFQTQASFQLLQAYHEQLELTKRGERTVTFDDIAFRLADWMNRKGGRLSPAAKGKVAGSSVTTSNPSNADQEAVAHSLQQSVDFRLDARIDHLLLDEFQDTSPIQWDIVKPFAEAITRERIRRDRSFFCVGDGKQAIYGWRGGVAEILQSVVGELHTQEDQLSKSHRSSAVVIDFVNEVFTNLHRHENFGDGGDAIHSWEKIFVRHDTAKGALPGYVQLLNGPKKSRASDSESDGEGSSDFSHLELAAQDISQLAQAAPHISIGVLVRSNSDVGKMIHLLRMLKVDASQEGGNPLADSAPVDLLLNLFQLADHPSDRIAGFQLARSPMASRLGLDPLNEADALAEQVRGRIVDGGYGASLAFYADLIAPVCNARDQQRLEQLIQMAYRYDARPTNRIRDFVQFVRDEKVAMPTPSQVRVMTIHLSKGLEFDAVFLPALTHKLSGSVPTFVARSPDPVSKVDGVARYIGKEAHQYLPSTWQKAFQDYSQQLLAEATCVFYVALTRARQALYLYGEPSKEPKSRWDSVLHSVLCSSPELRAQAEAIVYQIGNDQWYAASAPSTATSETTDSSGSQGLLEDASSKEPRADLVPLSIQLHMATAETTTRLRPTTRPSSAADGREAPLRKALEPTGSTGAIIGTLIHRWFEEVEWLDTFHWDRQAMRSLGLATLTPIEISQISLEDQLDAMERMLQLPSVQESLKKARYQQWLQEGVDELQVSNERRLMEILDSTMLRGTIDRLVLGCRRGKVVRAEVLDYKTDSRDPRRSSEDWQAERMEHHRPQLELYRRVLCKQFGIAPTDIQLTLLLLSDNSWVRLDAGHASRRGRSSETGEKQDLFTPSLFPDLFQE